jgi:DNA polymerase-3 subunit delta
MHALDFLKQARPKAGKPLYALVGEDVYLRREALRALVRQALGDDAEDQAPVRFAGETAKLADVLDELRTLPFLATRRVVLVDSADAFVTAHRKGLEAYAEHPSATGTLVLAVKTWPATTRLAKLFAAGGLNIDCKAPTEGQLPEWIVRQASQAWGAQFDPEAARLLLELVGPEVGLLAAEVDKLCTYVGDRRTVEPADVITMVGAGRVETIWRVLDAASTGQPAEALDLLDRLLTSGEYPAGLLAAISTSLRKVHHAGWLRKNRWGLADACKEAGIPAYRNAIEVTGRQHAHLGPSRVDRLPELLLRADLDLKGFSQLPPRVVLERLILELASPRTD